MIALGLVLQKSMHWDVGGKLMDQSYGFEEDRPNNVYTGIASNYGDRR